MSPPFQTTAPTSVGVGLFTGAAKTVTGISGPPLALLYQHVQGPTLRSTVATCFLVGEIISLCILSCQVLSPKTRRWQHCS
jgi:hypothetical protein